MRRVPVGKLQLANLAIKLWPFFDANNVGDWIIRLCLAAQHIQMLRADCDGTVQRRFSTGEQVWISVAVEEAILQMLAEPVMVVAQAQDGVTVSHNLLASLVAENTGLSVRLERSMEASHGQ